MVDFLLALAEVFLDGVLTRTGRGVLSLVGWKSNIFVEALLGLFLWVMGVVLLLAVMVSLLV